MIAEFQWIVPILCILVIGLVLNHLRLRKRFRDRVARQVLVNEKILPMDFDEICRRHFWTHTVDETTHIVRNRIASIRRQNEIERFRARSHEK